MPKTESLDELIAKNAAEFADQIKAAAQMADKEEEIRIEAERQLAFIEKQTGIKLEGKHEFTVASGRADSVYDRVIIEYKNPKSPGARIGPKADSPGSKKVVEQIKNRFYDMRTAHGHQLNTMFGVGLDGNYFIFIRFRDDKWHVQEPVEVNKYSAERFLWALYNLGQKGKPFSSEYLAGDFGSDSKLAQDGVRALYNAIIATDNPKAQIFFSQWKILFGEVCGYDVDNPSDKIKKLAEFYGVEHRRKFKAAELLFAVHSYYAIFMKLLASEIAAYFHKLPTPLQKMIQASSSNALKRELEDLEAGSIFRHLNITNFLEGDLFAWYIPVWSEPIEQLVRGMVARLDDYNPGTLSEDPAGSRDLLKKLYQQLFPKSVRHDLGEYYTPDWLADHVLNELEYLGDPDKRLLDPACGSGTFLVMAINRIRKWYDENREDARFDEGDLCRKILSNVIGFDLNPLAVMAARTNYLIAIRDLVGDVDRIEIPIYLCDSIMTPSEYGGLFGSGLGKAKELNTAAAKFIIPTEIAVDRDSVAKYAEQLEFGVRNGYSTEEFVQRCRDEGLPITEDSLHSDLYKELVTLDKANKNGVWARIIKNAFAPLFIGQTVDYVVGNPPWVNWNNLPAHYREQLIELNQAVYDLFPHKGARARHGSASIDISTLFVYVGGDKYLVNHGLLGFVITQSVFKSSGGSEGFRRFALPDGTPLGVFHVDDFSSIQPFEGAQNRTAVLCLQRGTATEYPLDYVLWESHDSENIEDANGRPSLKQTNLRAWPVQNENQQSPWITVESEYAPSIRKVLGVSTYEAKLGVHTWLNGAYWLAHDETAPHNLRLIVNAHDIGKKKVRRIEAVIESDLVYPLLRGRDVRKWSGNPRMSIIVPHDPGHPGVGISEAVLKRKYSRTFDYFQQLRPSLEGRSGYKKFIKPAGGPFFAVYNIGSYTFKPFRVVWREQASSLQACVISHDSEGRFIIPDHKLTIIGLNSEEEAHFICALLNSTPVQCAVGAYSIEIQISTHVTKVIGLPRYDQKNTLHRQIAEAGHACHDMSSLQEVVSLGRLEDEIDVSSAMLWHIEPKELELLRKAADRTDYSGDAILGDDLD